MEHFHINKSLEHSFCIQYTLNVAIMKAAFWPKFVPFTLHKTRWWCSSFSVGGASGLWQLQISKEVMEPKWNQNLQACHCTAEDNIRSWVHYQCAGRHCWLFSWAVFIKAHGSFGCAVNWSWMYCKNWILGSKMVPSHLYENCSLSALAKKWWKSFAKPPCLIRRLLKVVYIGRMLFGPQEMFCCTIIGHWDNLPYPALLILPWNWYRSCSSSAFW